MLPSGRRSDHDPSSWLRGVPAGGRRERSPVVALRQLCSSSTESITCSQMAIAAAAQPNHWPSRAYLQLCLLPSCATMKRCAQLRWPAFPLRQAQRCFCALLGSGAWKHHLETASRVVMVSANASARSLTVGVVGLSTIAKQRPHLSQLLCRIVREATTTCFTTIMMNFNPPAPVHQDAYNQGQNVVVPIIMPKKGGHLWLRLELQPGDAITGEIEVRPTKSGNVAGQIVQPSPSQAVHFNPKRLRATQAWSGGDRLIVAQLLEGLPRHKCNIARSWI